MHARTCTTHSFYRFVSLANEERKKLDAICRWRNFYASGIGRKKKYRRFIDPTTEMNCKCSVVWCLIFSSFPPRARAGTNKVEIVNAVDHRRIYSFSFLNGCASCAHMHVINISIDIFIVDVPCIELGVQSKNKFISNELCYAIETRVCTLPSIISHTRWAEIWTSSSLILMRINLQFETLKNCFPSHWWALSCHLKLIIVVCIEWLLY